MIWWCTVIAETFGLPSQVRLLINCSIIVYSNIY